VIGADANTLYLLRHAKSSWEDSGLDDHDRPLAPRGERAGAAMERHLRATGVRPDLVICSTAVRARQTLALVAAGLGERSGPEVVFDRRIYGASATGLLDRLREVDEAVRSVLLVGHQPGIQDLALALIGAGEGLDRISGKFPTAALATIAVPPPWSRLERGTGRVLDVVKPKQLPG
jgi:phosphohistidine phosphatase